MESGRSSDGMNAFQEYLLFVDTVPKFCSSVCGVLIICEEMPVIYTCRTFLTAMLDPSFKCEKLTLKEWNIFQIFSSHLISI